MKGEQDPEPGEGEGGEGRRGEKFCCHCAVPSVLSFSHLFNLTSKNDALVLREFFCSDVGTEFHKFGCNDENFDGSYFGHLWLWPGESAQLTAARGALADGDGILGWPFRSSGVG